MINTLAAFTLIAMGALAEVSAPQGQSTGKAEQLLHQVHASRVLLGEPLEGMADLLARCDSVWIESRGASWARMPEGVQAEAEGLLWLERALEEPLPGAREVSRPDRTLLARYLLLARSDLPPEAVKLRVPCEQLEMLVADLREKARAVDVDVHARSWNSWRKVLAEAVIEEPRAGEEAWSGSLKLRVSAVTGVDVYFLGDHVEQSVIGEEVVAGRYERSLRPHENEWQGIVVVGKDAVLSPT